MAKQLVRLALVMILVSLACSLPGSSSLPSQSVPSAISQLLVTVGPNATATPTPFQPVGPTATVNPTATKIPLPTATPDPDLAGIPGINTQMREKKELPEGTVTFLVLGNDYRPSSGYRTDVMMLVAVNTKKGTVNIVSFPRDLYVTIPGWMEQRLNTAFAHGGFSMMADTMEYNFGVRPEYYVMTNFQGFVGIINSLGGINVEVGQYLRDTCDLPQASWGYCAVSPGTTTMDGATALWYSRSRHSTNDIDRTRRHQEVLYAIFSKLMNLNVITRLPDLYSNFKSSVETNIGLDLVVPLAPVATKLIGDSSLINRYTIGYEQVTDYTTPSGAMVLLPNYEAIWKVIDEAFYKK